MYFICMDKIACYDQSLEINQEALKMSSGLLIFVFFPDCIIEEDGVLWNNSDLRPAHTVL